MQLLASWRIPIRAEGGCNRWSWKILLALLSLYLIWGSTYLAWRYALESLPPLLTAGERFLTAGLTLYVALRLSGRRDPGLKAWLSATVVGSLLVLAGSGLLCLAQERVHSGLAAVAIATVGLWTALINGLLGRWPSRGESCALGLGLLGVLLLNLEGNLLSQPAQALMLLAAAFSWALGSVVSLRLPAAAVPMPTAMQMISGGTMLIISGWLHGEKLAPHPTARSLWAFAYLVFFGSILAFSAYAYLLEQVSSTVATSYAYVNPLVAVLLGVALAGEKIGLAGGLSLALILASVALSTKASPGMEPGPPRE